MRPRAPHRRRQTPPEVPFRIEVPRGSFGKRDAEGTLEFPSPVPCPFNYGSVPGARSADGEGADVVVLGPRLPLGHEGTLPVRAVVVFNDAGLEDDKWVCSARPLDRRDRAALVVFFSAYGLVKRLTAPLRGRRGASGFVALLDPQPPSEEGVINAAPPRYPRG